MQAEALGNSDRPRRCGQTGGLGSNQDRIHELHNQKKSNNCQVSSVSGLRSLSEKLREIR